MLLLNKIHPQITLTSIITEMLTGAVLGFIVISFFVFGVDNPNPAWDENWRVRPLIIAPLVGGLATLALLLKYFVRFDTKILNDLLILFSFVLAFIGLWIGIILGLDGTMWD